MKLTKTELRELRACKRFGYTSKIRTSKRSGQMLDSQWKAWKSLSKKRLADIWGDGKYAEELVITAAGQIALKEARQ